jgi:TRAP-type C4-dicarboxylate transport system permease large subunit
MRHILPFFVSMIVVLFICTYIPALSLWLPEKLGLLSQGVSP